MAIGGVVGRRRTVLTAAGAAVGSLALILGVVAVPAAGAATYTGSSDPSVSFTVADQVVVGESITVSGTGWKNKAGDCRLDHRIKLDEGAVLHELYVLHPVTGAVQANKTIYGLVQASSDGNWSVDLPFLDRGELVGGLGCRRNRTAFGC